MHDHILDGQLSSTPRRPDDVTTRPATRPDVGAAYAALSGIASRGGRRRPLPCPSRGGHSMISRPGAGLLLVALVVSGVTGGCGGGGGNPHVALNPQASADATTTSSTPPFQLPSLPPDTTTTTIAVNVPSATPLPNPRLTPGLADPRFTMTDVCSRTIPLAALSSTVRSQVLDRYGIPTADRAKFVVDHLISRVIGGSDDLANLWPMPISDSWIHNKNRLEAELLYRVCAIKFLTLAEAQRQEAANWYVAFVRDVQQHP
jgi:hypothetical protein